MGSDNFHMADYPADVASEHRLADGRTVLIRPIRADDETEEQRFFAGLSDEAKSMRFMKFVGALNERLIHSFSHVDYEARMAFVCEHKGRIVGEARYSALPYERSCDFGIVIADDWHRSGIAGLLMDALIRQARAQGFDTMEGMVLRLNHPMLKFVRALGFELLPLPLDPTLVQVLKSLRPVGETIHSL
jgi:acetyltransferase